MPEKVITSQALRLCTWNIQLGLSLETILQELEKSADFHGLDLLALQEASIQGNREDASLMAEALGTTYDSFQVTAGSFSRREQANALIWNTRRVRVESKEVIKLPRREEVILGATERTLLRVLPATQRISLAVQAEFNDKTIRMYSAHLDVVGFEHKREQLRCILRDAQRRSGVDLTILAGDFNTFGIRSKPSWQSFAAIAQAANFQDITKEIGWTHSVSNLNLRQKLDAILLSSRHPFRFRSWSVNARGSDHIPVFADITLD